MEYDCTMCGGSGQILIPHPVMNANDEPAIEMVMTTCTVCNGNGKVYVL